MMTIFLAIIAIVLLGLVASAGALVLTYRRLPMQFNNIVCMLCPEKDGECKRLPDCKVAKEMSGDFFSRRNEFWQSTGQLIMIALLITVLTVLLLTDKASAEAALPIMASLASFAVGKVIAGTRGFSGDDKIVKQPPEHPGKSPENAQE